MNTTTLAFEVSDTTVCEVGYQCTFRAGGTIRNTAALEMHLAYMQHGGGGEYIVGDGPAVLVTPSFVAAAERVSSLFADGVTQVVVTYGSPIDV